MAGVGMEGTQPCGFSFGHICSKPVLPWLSITGTSILQHWTLTVVQRDPDRLFDLRPLRHGTCIPPSCISCALASGGNRNSLSICICSPLWRRGSTCLSLFSVLLDLLGFWSISERNLRDYKDSELQRWLPSYVPFIPVRQMSEEEGSQGSGGKDTHVDEHRGNTHVVLIKEHKTVCSLSLFWGAYSMVLNRGF